MSQPIALGLTGSIGMGKSTTAAMFADAGCAIWDADAAVHRLYDVGGAAVPVIAALHARAVIDDAVSRSALKDWIATEPAALAQLEAAVHPLVAADRAAFRVNANAPIAVFDIPLLFETGADKEMDATAVVSVPADVQRVRVLARPGMTEPQLQMILARQMSDAEKRQRADFIIEALDMDKTRQIVLDIVKRLEDRHAGNRSGHGNHGV